VKKPTIDDVQHELTSLESEEARLSAERVRLHNQIDFGFETGTTRDREREISDERRRVHGRIDSLKKLLRTRQAG
jgi:hypothetical protein